MKFIGIIVLFLISFSAFSYSVVRIPGQCFVNRSQSTCQVCNYSNRVMSCQVRSNSITYRGYNVQNWRNGVLFPGQCAVVSTFAPNPAYDPFRWAYANGYCRL